MTVPTIDCGRYDELLSDYLESTLSLPLRAAIDAHATSCARCAALLADVRSIVDRAGSLPALQPSRDLWPAVAERLDAPVVSIGAAPSAHRRLRVPAWIGVAAAAAVLIVVTSVVTRQWVTGGNQAAPPVVAVPSARVTQPESLGIESTTVTPIATPAGAVSRERVSASVTYGREIARLQAILRQRATTLDPTTTAIIENSMRIIDSAIVEARAALARDPASRFLIDQVDKTLEKKMELLRTVAFLSART
jgi:anti-sigma factor RsiW